MWHQVSAKLAQAARVGARAQRKLTTGSTPSVFGKAVAAGATGAAAFTAFTVAADEAVPTPHFHWNHDGYFSSYDHGAMRRGYEVYRQVCSTCHSMDLLAFRNLVGETHTEEQAKALAASYEVKDGPDDEGNFFERPAKLSDPLPRPYESEEQARFINGGALPPDLSCIAKARHGGENYIFALLTGYKDPPEGIELREGLHYNPYFAGGAIAMAPPLQPDGVEYEDGTVASVPQMAKDVSTFLAWCSEPEHDARKLQGVKLLTAMVVAGGLAGYYKRFKWSIFKTRRISYTN
jgi:ubiquinol-cytochrome c reductase cytochrome c1 subunit